MSFLIYNLIEHEHCFCCSVGSGDLLDAAICAVQAAWAATRPDYGIPASAPAGEGWIITA